MVGTDFTLDLLGPVILEMREELRDLKRDVTLIREEGLPALERRLSCHADEMTVLSTMVMRYSAEPIAWGAMQCEMRILRERLEALESKR